MASSAANAAPPTVVTGGGQTGKRTIEIAGDTLEITPLGSGQEVGRSCVVMSFKGKSVMFDCGVHPGLSGMAQLPYFDKLQEEKKRIDLCLITHFHMDHSGAVPYFVNRTDFRGRVLMTHPTKSICKMLWQDHSKINKINNDDLIYTFKDIERTCQKIELIDLRQVIDIDGMRITCFSAGHVLGAAMFLVEIAGIRVLYTGDYSREEDRHLMPAEIPPMRIHVLIVESTYGTQSHEDRKIRETRFLAKVVSVVKNGGKVLLPSFALGRAQELLLMLEEHWQKSPELQHVPIYYNSPMALKCSRIFETFTHLARGMESGGQNPWQLRFVKSIGTENREKTIEVVNTRSACVVLAAPGMLQNGFSRELFELWAGGRENAVIMTGYSVDGTIAKDLEKQPDQLNLPDGRIVHVRCTIDNISFSAHSDYTQTSAFIREIRTNHVILVHGEETNMTRMRNKLRTDHGDSLKVYTPANTQSVAITFRPDLGVTIAGKLAINAYNAAVNNPSSSVNALQTGGGDQLATTNELALSPESGTVSPIAKRHKGNTTTDNTTLNKTDSNSKTISGILVEDAFGDRSLISPHELATFTKLEVCSFEQTQKFQFRNNLAVLAKAIEGIYQDVALVEDDEMLVQNCVRLKLKNQILELSWKASPVADMVADSIVLVALEITRSPIAVQALTAQIMDSSASSNMIYPSGNTGSVENKLWSVWTSYLRQTYGEEIKIDEKNRLVNFQTDKSVVRIDFSRREVDVQGEKVREMKNDILQSLTRCENALQPVPKF
ncbi:unnamed protein product [Amoebophrya sp. A120]|nr:unnamed protein product [Amoebophrya sp. A120]|eukprot:GSA120T00010186001.1